MRSSVDFTDAIDRHDVGCCSRAAAWLRSKLFARHRIGIQRRDELHRDGAIEQHVVAQMTAPIPPRPSGQSRRYSSKAFWRSPVLWHADFEFGVRPHVLHLREVLIFNRRILTTVASTPRLPPLSSDSSAGLVGAVLTLSAETKGHFQSPRGPTG